MNLKLINWFALAGAIVILLLVPISFYYPWWQLVVGESLFQVDTSPVNTQVSFTGTQLNIPIIWALNTIGLLTFIAAGTILLIYALMPQKAYSIDLLGFAYKKPLYAVIAYVIGLFVAAFLVNSLVDLNIPVMGTTMIKLPEAMTSGASVSVAVTTAFQWPFWIAIFAAIICIIARIYHPKIPKPTQQTITNPN